MRVKMKHFGHMCRCTQCQTPIYVTYDTVMPPVKPFELDAPRHFGKDEVPVHWKVGDVFMDQYVVEEKIGEGGMGEVHRVHHRGWGVDVAVKSLSPHLLSHPEQVENFQHECELWVNLGLHPHIVTCYYVRRLGGVPRVFIEYMPGRSLLEWLRDGRLYEGDRSEILKRILDIAIQFAWGLNYAHEEGLVHLDVKPSNLLLLPDGHAKVTDFGLSRPFTTGGEGVEDEQLYMGTPSYLAPERNSASEVSAKTDLWSWALCIIELFEGRVTWRDGTQAREVLATHRTRGSVRTDIDIPPMPGGLAELFEQCFEEKPENRPANLLDVVERIKEIYAKECGADYPRATPRRAGNTAESLNNGAVSLLDLGKYGRAEKMWQDALAFDPNHVESIYNSWLHRWRQGKTPVGAFLKTLYDLNEGGTNDWRLSLFTAQILNECGQYNRALHVLKSVPEEDRTRKEVIRALDVARAREKSSRRLISEFNAHGGQVTSVDMSWDGWLALSTSLDGTAMLWELATGEASKTFRGHKGEVYSGCISRDEKTVLTGGQDRTVRVWDAKTGKCTRTLEGHRDSVVSVDLGWESRRAISASLDHTLRLWDLQKGQCVHILKSHTDCVDVVELHRSGKWAVSGGRDKLVKLWNLATGQCVRNFEGHTDRVTGVRMNDDGSKIFSTCKDGSLYVWDASTGVCTKTIQAHRSDAYALELARNGAIAATASKAWTFRLWDVATAQCLYTFEARAPIALSRDGRYALSSGKGGALRLWGVYCDQEIARAPFALCRDQHTRATEEPTEV